MIRMYVRRLTGGRWPSIRRGEQLACPEVARLLQQFVDDEVDDPVVVEALSAHVDHCAPCGYEAETFRSIKVALAARRVPVEPDSVDRLRSFGSSLMRES
ncbi:MAG: hypothetical protein KDB37_05775 [Ilumatobacter sp.]|nr:hypothetical protein [Ilumatobacter sp.]